jgi:HlyD family secretion protein
MSIERKWVAMAFAMTLAGVTACSRQDGDRPVLGTLERDRLELIAEANEPIVAIAVHEGDRVQPGQKLLEQDLGPMRARLDQAVAAGSVAERRLAELIKGPRAQEITEARAALESAQSALATENNEYRRVTDLVERKLLSQSLLDQARARRDSAAAGEKQAAARVNLLLEGTRREAIEQSEASLKQAHAALAELESSAARFVVTAPRPGRIEAIPYKLGERPPAGAPVMVMLADGVPYARVYVPETRRAHFAAGSAVSLKVDGYEQPFAGVVRFISAQAAFTPYYALTQDDRTRLSYLAEIDIPDGDALPTGIPVRLYEGREEK